MPPPTTGTTGPTGPAIGPFRATGYAAVQVLCFLPVLLLFVGAAVGGVLAIAGVGVPLLLAALPGARWFADRHRAMAALTLGAPVHSPYLPLTGRPLADLRIRATDPATWRDLLWMVWALTVGFALSLVVTLLFVCVVTLTIWWFGAAHLMRLRASVDRWILCPGHTEQLEQRVHALTESRADVVDHSAAELRRIERDLHDGPQARLAAVSLSLGMAADLFDEDPQSARRMVAEARATSSTVLGELRDVVRSIHPPVLADRGLGGAVEALALDMAFDVDLDIALPHPLPPPIESAVYFAVAECLANAGKHAAAHHVCVALHHDGQRLTGAVGDDGRGGVDPRTGSGLRGLAARLAAFDGTMSVSSPAGGPTVVQWEVPCTPSTP
ncbi:MAG: sensor domain-containing protein, partial [Nocardioidaceae bacterium]|nr:sensor domain-containing protein [Nocardioidaceae bacterium]